ncbi:hypothetical protein Nepgr_006386 [Nepenthes gracilis]|uniref:Protein CHROMOSOME TRANSMISSION FIDELITY 7 n=1 Tax=Nepenthes gracilis TaxID=150966 RepID=A0AAD3XHJ3_NEPGR|nr:hypothetical protein Nepgr_006386 [Nepenthes gracilis]
MQKKIKSFFKPSAAKSPGHISAICNDSFDEIWSKKQPEICVKYIRKASNRCQSTKGDGLICEEVDKPCLEDDKLKQVRKYGMVLNKKRRYAQFHLDLGQSDFLLHTCSTCGAMYAKGDDGDEKFHNTLHKNYTNGIQFKGWRCERVIHMPLVEGGRIILVLNTDPPVQMKKVHEVVKMMEIELGDGWIFHELHKVYLYIYLQRIAACVVAEPISKAYRVLSDSVKKSCYGTRKKAVLKSTKIQFGGVCFQREVVRRVPLDSSSQAPHVNLCGAIICEEESVPAVCGIRAIWVSPSNRRKGIASHLLDAVRISFCKDSILEPSQLAFSQPTSAGRALASRYTGTGSFLVYKTS